MRTHIMLILIALAVGLSASAELLNFSKINLPKSDLSGKLTEIISESHQPTVETKTIKKMKLGRSCLKESLELSGADPVNGHKRHVEVDMYTPAVTDFDGAPLLVAHKGNLIVVPTIAGVSPLEKSFATTACLRKYRAVIIRGWQQDNVAEIDIEAHDYYALRSLVAVRHILDYLSEPTQIIGASLGSLYSSVAFATDERLIGAALITAGADLPSILANSKVSQVIQLKQRRFNTFGYSSDEEYLQALRAKVHFSPELFVSEKAKEKPLLMVFAQNDNKIPAQNQAELIQLWEPDILLVSKHGHVRTIVDTLLFRKSRLFDFFDKNIERQIRPDPVIEEPIF
jgi:predicted alpha/beta hydrolase family esterase